MRVTVLGKSPSWQDAGGACSGYLVRDGDDVLLLDCGNGVFAKLRRELDYGDVGNVMLSHLHADHFLDLVPFSYALLYSPREHAHRPVLNAPPGARDIFRRVCGAWGSEDLIERAFEIREYTPGDELAVGGIAIATREVDHFVQCCAVGLQSGDGGRFVFGADTGPSDSLVEFATGADTLMVESTLLAPDGDDGEPRGHLTAGEAGEHAARAGVRRLVLTHITDELDSGHARDQAAAVFGGEVVLAAEGLTLEV